MTRERNVKGKALTETDASVPEPPEPVDVLTPPEDANGDPDAPALPAPAARPGFLARVTAALKRPRHAPRDTAEEDAAARDVLDVPPVPDGWSVLETRELNPGYAVARILEHASTKRRVYETLEPVLTEDESRVLAFLKDAFVSTLDVDMDALDAKGARAYLDEAIHRFLHDYGLDVTPTSRARIAYYVNRDFLGFGPLDAIMRDKDIEDVSCDGPEQPIYLYDRRHESLRTNVAFANADVLDGFVMELVQKAGKDISVATPLVDATLPDGSRLQASFSTEVTTRGSTFTIRKYRDEPFTVTDLLSLGTADARMLAYFWLIVENGLSGVFCGGTASGKTTTLNAVTLLLPQEEKIVSIEDTREINLPHENWIPAVTRGSVIDETGRVERRGSVTMFDLLKSALRQRPEYLLFGEIRGREAYVLFQAMATGHTVYSTMHADSAESAVYRLESRPIEIPRIMLNALDVLVIQVQARVNGQRVRRIKEVVEITGIDPASGDLLTNRVFTWDAAADRHAFAGASAMIDRIAAARNQKPGDVEAELDRRARLLAWMAETGVRHVPDVMRVVTAYAQDPERVLAEAGLTEATE